MIDWTHVAQLRDEVGPDDFEEIIEIFLTEVDDGLSVLQSQAPCNMASALHALRGCAMSLGFTEFSAVCQNGEDLAARGQSDLVNLPEVLQSYAASRARFLSDLPELRAG
ncbi:Hpt domain-containing protein [Sulfitobacter sabulilitoris]|uniref:Hpt domain-containing protein n=1 Tax=Sulfitobacter sabulilitoris TaxID=2562655 RepID=A0A5S3PF60_9RHOB|nr:Hpt domain-containing protein [Sulfitobacter sabulilitoris]TMM52619.1 Hpt domain-containing protein [Sulfitobacter sabulilitoris]